MSDLEYFSTISAFVAGFVFLIYLFRVRASIIRRVKLRLVQAKAKLHQMTAPVKPNIWGEAAGRKRDIR